MNSFNHKIANAGFLAVMMVVGIHTAGRPAERTLVWWWDLLSHYGVFSIAVPFFFVCSGYFLARHVGDVGWYRSACVKRFWGLLVPYLIWSLVAALIPAVLAVVMNAFDLNAMETAVAKAWPHDWWRIAGLDVFHYPAYVPLWYVRALLMFTLVCPFVVWGLRTFGLLGLLALWVFWMLFCFSKGHPHIEGFFGPFFSLRGLFWFAVGCWIAFNECRASSIWHRVCRCRYWLLSGGIAVVCLRVAWFAHTGDPHKELYPIFIPMLLAAFWSFVPDKPWPRILTRMTFAIYILHTLVWWIVFPVCKLTVVTPVGWLIKWLVGFAGAWLVAVVMSRFMPRIAGIMFGGRI